MDIQESLDGVSDFFGGISRWFENKVTSMFGSSNERELKKIMPRIQAINDLEPKYQAMSDEDLRGQTAFFRKRLAAGETLDDLLPEAFAVCREAGNMHWPHLIDNALEGKGVHVVTVNDYLARRDMEWMGPIYMALGMTVGSIQSNMSTTDRQYAYSCDVTYGTNNEYGFDYLRDNMRYARRGDANFPADVQQSQGLLHYAIIDEVDNILIDEARTPLIIAGSSRDDVSKYRAADSIGPITVT